MRFLILQAKETTSSRKQISLAKALTLANSECLMWRYDIKPAFDAFDEFKPDVLICNEEQSSIRAIQKCAKENSTRIITDLGLPAADIVSFYGGKVMDEFVTENLIIATSLTQDEINRAIDFCRSRPNTKIFGGSIVPCYQYCGQISLEHAKNAIASAKQCIDVKDTLSDEPFMYVINNKLIGLTSKPFSDMFSNSSRDVFRNHTYFDRAAVIFETLQDSGRAAKCIKEKERILHENISV